MEEAMTDAQPSPPSIMEWGRQFLTSPRICLSGYTLLTPISTGRGGGSGCGEEDGCDHKAPSISRRRCWGVGVVVTALLLFLILLLLLYMGGPLDCSNSNYVRRLWGAINGKGWLNTPPPSSSSSRPFLIRPPSTAHLDCGRILEGDKEYIEEVVSMNRTTLVDPKLIGDLPMDCDSIKRRHYFPATPLSAEESAFPLAYARIIYRDYLLLEMELSTAYSPNNHYCYAIDSKSEPLFQLRIWQLAECFPNVLVAPTMYRVDSAGHKMLPAFMECLQLLTNSSRKWEYAVLLQIIKNHDLTMKTNAEAVHIYQWLGGANDVEVTNLPSHRVNTTLDWSFDALHLFRNATRNNVIVDGFPPVMRFAKGYVESSLSRAMVEFMLKELDLRVFMERMDEGGYGIDEIMIPTLQAADAIQAPGGFTRACLDKGVPISHITRLTKWGINGCKTQHIRHIICIFGVEDLKWLATRPHLFVNKIMPDFDFGAITCWREHIYNRTYNGGGVRLEELDEHFYRNLPHVRFQETKALAKSHRVAVNSVAFDCKGKGKGG